MYDRIKNKGILQVLQLTSCRQLTLIILSYLSPQDLIELQKIITNENSFLAKLLQTQICLDKLLGQVDPTIYFSFYDSIPLSSVKLNLSFSISQQFPSLSSTLISNFQIATHVLQQQLVSFNISTDQIIQIIVNPELPLPKLKRQTQGLYCTSSFQLFLISRTFSMNEQQWNFMQLREKLQQKEEDYLRHFMKISKQSKNNSGNLKTIMQVRYTPFQITGSNFKSFIICEHQLHNIIVCLFALSDIVLQTINMKIKAIQDPLQKMSQILLRYSVYKNYVLAIQESFSFLFTSYEALYKDAVQEDETPHFQFWRPALTKWFIKMHPFMQQLSSTYICMFNLVRKDKLINRIKQQSQMQQINANIILSNIQELDLQQKQLKNILATYGSDSLGIIGQILFEDKQKLQILIVQYQEYFMDVSINQQTVHWCGHSEHYVQKPYIILQQKLIKYNEYFLESISSKLSQKQLNFFVNEDTVIISCLQVKNRTIKKMVNQSIKILNRIEKQIKMQDQNQNIVKHIQKQHKTVTSQILLDLEQADKKLQYYNKKAAILATIDQNARPFYSITPLCTAEKLIQLIQTNQSSNQDNEYLSDSEQQEKLTVEQKQKLRQNNQFLQDKLNISNGEQNKINISNVQITSFKQQGKYIPIVVTNQALQLQSSFENI